MLEMCTRNMMTATMCSMLPCQHSVPMDQEQNGFAPPLARVQADGHDQIPPMPIVTIIDGGTQKGLSSPPPPATKSGRRSCRQWHGITAGRHS